LTIPSYWIRPPQILSGNAGSHRFIWDLRYPATGGGKGGGYSMAAIYKNTPGPQGPMVLPGQYTVKLTVDGQTYTQALTVKMDPRVQTPPEALKKQLELSLECQDGLRRVEEALAQVAELRARLKQRAADGEEEMARSIAALDEKSAVPLAEAGAELAALLGRLQLADAAPTAAVVAACGEARQTLTALLARWHELQRETKILEQQLSAK